MHRDDLFTHIHKALRRGLFDLAVATGATDWTDPADVLALEARWRPLMSLLRSHTRHEDRHILRILDRHGRGSAGVAGEEHRDLDDLLDDLDERLVATASSGDPVAGLDLYRDLVRFLAAYLPHLHHEETVVMKEIWDRCTDEDIASTRAAFMAEVSAEEAELSMELMLPALDRSTRAGLVAVIADSAPPVVVESVLTIGDRVLGPSDAAALRGAVRERRLAG